MKIIYQSALRTISIKHWPHDANVLEPGYHAGQFDAHYPVPALRTDMLYWRMPSFPTWKLVAQWHMWNQGYRTANKVTIY